MPDDRAWIVSDRDEGAALIEFAPTRGKARMLYADECGMDWWDAMEEVYG